MKNLLILSILLFTISSCGDNSGIRQKPKEQQIVALPAALQDEESKSSYSKRGNDMLDDLYDELVEKTSELKDVEDRIHTLQASRDDSFAAYSAYRYKIDEYYSVAQRNTMTIRDTVLKKEIERIITNSITQYKSGIAQHLALANRIDSTSARLNDLHTIMKITLTLPLIEEYQKTKKPSVYPLMEYSKKVDSAMRIVKRHIKR